MYKKRRFSAFSFINYFLFVIISIIMAYPFWYVLMYSISEPNNVSMTSYYLIPNGFTLSTFGMVLKEPSIYSGFLNSVFVTVVGTIINLVLTAMTAYPLSRGHLKGQKFFFGLIMFTMIFNGGIIPTYLVVRSFKMVNSLWALIIPDAIIVYNLLIMIKFFKNIPESIIESAKIDGCNDIAILTKIVLPLSTAVLAALGLFYAVYHWNEFLRGMIYLNDKSKWPLQVVLKDMLDQTTSNIDTGGDDIFTSPENFKMATVIVTVVPILLVYPFLQKYFTKGIMLGSVKG